MGAAKDHSKGAEVAAATAKPVKDSTTIFSGVGSSANGSKLESSVDSRAAIDSIRRARLHCHQTLGRIVTARCKVHHSSGVRAIVPFVSIYFTLAMALCYRMEGRRERRKAREEREEEDRKLCEKRESLHLIHNDLITIKEGVKEGVSRGFWARFFSSR